MKTRAPRIAALLACGAVASLFIYQAMAAPPVYETNRPVSVSVAGQLVQLPAGRTVEIIGAPSAAGTVGIRVQLPSGAVSIAQIPVASLRAKPIAAPTPAAVAAAGTPAPSTPFSSQLSMGSGKTATGTTTTTGSDQSGLADQFKFRGEAGGKEVPLHKEWKLVWEADFAKDNKIDPAKWNIAINGKGNGNQELQYYSDDPKNLFVANGVLNITAIKEKKDWAQYTSGKLTTRGKYSVQYGRIEACIKSPKAQKGSWPAFWMMPEEDAYGNWPKSGEIDIMEMVNKYDKLHGTLHFFRGGKPDHKGAEIPAPSAGFDKDFHVYAVEWEPTTMRWYVDGKYYGSLSDWKSDIGPMPAPFNKKFHIILNFAVGGQWPGPPDNSSEFPQTMQVKYVRVYQP